MAEGQLDPLRSFLESQYGSESKENLVTPGSVKRTVIPTSGLGDTFSRGLEAGALGLSADLSYFQALGSTLFGADELAKEKVQEARSLQMQAGGLMEGVPEFEEFVDNPTIEGFFTQAVSGSAQIIPSAVSTIAGAAVGGIGGVLGKAALTASGRLAAQKVVKEALEKTAKKTADADDLEIAQSAWDLYRGGVLSTAKAGAITGAAATEFAPLAGSNLSEALESGKELNPLQAIRASLVAVPQTAIGVGGEIALAKLIGTKALKNSGGNESTIMGRLGRDILDGASRGGVIEAGTETVQEAIAVANRTLLDENYDQQQARLRLGEAAFAAFFGGASIGGTGSALGGTVREVVNSPATVKGVMDKARTWLDAGQQQQNDTLSSEEELGPIDPIYTNPESQADINAQLEAMLDPDSAKQAVWVESDTPALGVTSAGKVNTLNINGQTAYGAFIPGRGTIISQYADMVQEVLRSEASDDVLAVQLGYSSAKLPGADRVVQVKDANGNVISEEVTTDEGLPAAVVAADKLTNRARGDTYSVRDVADVLRERKQKYDAERGPIIRNMDIEDEIDAERAQTAQRELEAVEAEFKTAVDAALADPEDQNKQNEIRRLAQERSRLTQIVRETQAQARASTAPQEDLAEEVEETLLPSEQTDLDIEIDDANIGLLGEEGRETRTFNIDEVEEIERKDYQERAQDDAGYVLYDARYKDAGGRRGRTKERNSSEEVREEFKKVFADGAPEGLPNDIDFTNPVYAGMSDSALTQAIRYRLDGLAVRVIPPSQQADQEAPALTETGDAKYSVIAGSGFDVELFSTPKMLTEELSDGRIRKFRGSVRVPIKAFLRNEVSRATKSLEDYRNVIIVKPNGKEVEASLVSLVNAGKRLVQTRLASGAFTGSGTTAGTALTEILGEFLQNGYSLKEKRGGKDFLRTQQVSDATVAPSVGAGGQGSFFAQVSSEDTAPFIDTLYRIAIQDPVGLQSEFAKLTVALEKDADNNVIRAIPLGEFLQYLIPKVDAVYEGRPDRPRGVDFDFEGERFTYPQQEDESQGAEYLKPRTIQYQLLDEDTFQEVESDPLDPDSGRTTTQTEDLSQEVFAQATPEPVATGIKGLQSVRIVDQPDTRAGETATVEAVDRRREINDLVLNDGDVVQITIDDVSKSFTVRRPTPWDPNLPKALRQKALREFVASVNAELKRVGLQREERDIAAGVQFAPLSLPEGQSITASAGPVDSGGIKLTSPRPMVVTVEGPGRSPEDSTFRTGGSRSTVRVVPEGEVDQTSRDRQVQTPIEGEVFAMANVKGRLDEGLSRIDGVDVPTDNRNTHHYDTRAPSRRKSPTYFQKAIETPLGKVPFLVDRLTKILFRSLPMTRPTAILLYSQFAGVRPSQIDAQLAKTIPDPIVRSQLIRYMRVLKGNSNRQGSMLGYRDSNFIFVDDSKTTSELETALVATHELAHAWFREERGDLVHKRGRYKGPNKEMQFKRLWDEWRAAKKEPDAPEAWKGRLGFEEWYVDNVAAWAYGEYKNNKPKNATESYFKRLVNKLKKMFNEMRKTFQRRFQGGNVTFESYMEFLARTQRNAFRETTGRAADQAHTNQDEAVFWNITSIEEEYYVRNYTNIIESGDKFPGPQGNGEGVLPGSLADQLRDFINAMRRDPRLNPVRKFFYTADSYLRHVTEPVGNAIADMFYVEAQQGGSGGRVGMLKRRDRQMRLFLTDFEKMVGDPNDPEIQRAIGLASGDQSLAAGDVMNAKAVAVREFLQKVYDEYILPAQEGYPATSDARIQFQEDYFPVVHNLLAVQADPNGYLELVLKYNPEIDKDTARRAVKRMLDYQDAVENNDLNIKELDPAANIEESRQLTKNIPMEELSAYLVEPTDALNIYLRSLTKRVEWNRATKAADGTELLQPLLDKLDKEQRKDAEDVIKIYLGYGNESMSPFWRKINSYAAAAQYTLLLPLAVIGSLPELAGPIINFKGFKGLEIAFKEGLLNLTTPEIRQLAEDIGVVANDALQNAYITMAEQEFLDPSARQWTDKFFRITFLDQYTQFTRTFATGMGVQFLVRHAATARDSSNPKSEESKRYLRDLGVSPADVNAWSNNEATDAQKKNVEDALFKFVESSILRPNAAERPMWASDPRFTLIWQLKSYFYAFNKVITRGMINEYKTRTADADNRGKVNAALGTAALFAVATLPLAMMGMELREYIKQGTAEAITLGFNEKDFFRTDKLSWSDYIWTAIDKTGIYGPWSLLFMAQQSAEWGQGGVSTLLGPTAETLEQTLQDGFEVIPDRLLPIYSYLY